MRSHKLEFLAAVALSAALTLPLAAQQSANQSTSAPGQAAQTTDTQNATQPAASSSSQTPASTSAQGAPSTSGQTATPSDQTTTTQPANTSQAAGQTDQSSTTTPMTQEQVQQRKLVPQTRQGFWGKINPFARKKYVKGQLQPIRDRVNELDELTASNGRAIADVDRRSRAGISDAQNRANQANQQASAAEQKAQQVSSKADQLDQQVTTVNNNLQSIDQYQVAQTAEIRFRPGVAKINQTAQQALDNFLSGLDKQKGYLVEVEAYSSGRGERAVQNSQRLASSVVRYLVLNHNIPLFRIYTMGLGNAPVQASTEQAQNGPKITRGGRVEIRILRNALANNNAPAANNPATQQQQPQPQQ